MRREIPRPEYPRPNLVRDEWDNLNGVWEFSFDAPVFDREILVPFCYQSEKSGIGIEEEHEAVWYRRRFSVRRESLETKRLWIHFNAVDYKASVYVNGRLAGTHEGGYTAFSFDITELLQQEENVLMVKAEDSQNQGQPRGKQTWRHEKFGCWYTPVTGIWQTVWLEYKNEVFLKQVRFTPDIDRRAACAEFWVSTNRPVTVTAEASIEKNGVMRKLSEASAQCRCGYGRAEFLFHDYDVKNKEELWWSPEHPNLIDVKLKVLEEGVEKDRVASYFGMRKIQSENGNVLLNNTPLYQRLILDQGYWKETLLTPPSDEAIRRDVELTLKLGFNGARKHQKIEDPRYYYWADKLGLLVWGELPSAYEFHSGAVKNSMRDLSDFVDACFNHPSIIFWVPLNESWGVSAIVADRRQQDYARAMYYTLRALDGTRLISTNDGWEQVNETDICAIHDYAYFPQNADKYDRLDGVLRGAAEVRLVYAEGSSYQGQPVILTEYGGISLNTSNDGDKWGYYENAEDEEEYLARLEIITRKLLENPLIKGFCYTQMTDVMQEANGLLTIDRQPKADMERLNRIFSGK